MKIACFIKKRGLEDHPATKKLYASLASSGCDVYDLLPGGLQEGTDLLLSIGGDGTFLTASHFALEAGIPIMGVNMGRIGFLADNAIDEVAAPLAAGEFTVHDRTMIEALIEVGNGSVVKADALNEVALLRRGAGMVGIDVMLGEEPLPAYWADGVLVSTACGSTAYSLSIGGPIFTPDIPAFILSPIAPHNLNMRPLVVGADSVIRMKLVPGRKEKACVSVDNRQYDITEDGSVLLQAAATPLKVASAGKSNFIDALRSKLFWGEDVRNNHQ